MIVDPFCGREYRKVSAFDLDDDLLETETDHTEGGSDHVEWFLFGLILFGLVAEVAIVLSTLLTAP